jgi:acetylornithine deacetylase/succinyl-diaminopimelate desuccinylase-like protein
MKKTFCLLGTIAICCTGFSQSKEILAVRKYTAANAGSIVHNFQQFLSIPNVAADTLGLQRTAQSIVNMLNERNVQHVQLLYAQTPGVPPAVYGDISVPGAAQTLLFYAHYDGQPVNAAQWTKPLQPFTPLLFDAAIDKGGKNIEVPANGIFNPEWRIYARGASDDKAGVFAILNALEALKNTGQKIHANIKFFFEGEEEAGSVHISEIMQKNAELLHSDLFIICDGPVHQSGKKQIVFGARGDAHIDLTVYASKRPLHSGHYGNWAPNPAMMLAKLLASMKDDDGHVTIKGFYDDVTPLTTLEKKALSEVPLADEQMKRELGIRKTEMTGKNLSEAINLPSLNINGFQSGNVGKMASNQIPAYATAVIDLRLVLGNNWQRQQQKLLDHVKAQGYYVINHEPTDTERLQYDKIIKIIPGADGYNAQRTPMDLRVVQKVIDAVKTTTASQVVLQPTMGGSLPLFLFEKYLRATTITVPIANHDNNQHAENENIRIGNLFDGIETMSALMLIK